MTEMISSIAEVLQHGKPIVLKPGEYYVIGLKVHLRQEDVCQVQKHFDQISARFKCAFLVLPLEFELVRESEATLLAYKLAFEAAAATICGDSTIEERADGKWMHLHSAEPELLADEFRYLELRGLLFRHPTDPDLFRVGDPADHKPTKEASPWPQ